MSCIYHCNSSLNYEEAFNKRRKHSKFIVLRCETKNQMKSLREMIGLHATHGLRDKKSLTNETETLRGGNTINIVIGSNEPEVTPFEFRCDRRSTCSCYDRNDMKVILLVRHEEIILEGSNAQERNDKCLSEIMHRA